MPKTSPQRVRPTGVETAAKSAGLGGVDIVSGPASRIGSPGSQSSGFEQLVTSLGSFARTATPALQQRAAAQRRQAEGEIQTAIASGKTLSDFEGKPEWWLHLANGAFGKSKGSDFMGSLAAELEEQPDADAQSLATARTADFLKSLPNDEQRANAAAVIGPRMAKLVETHQKEQRERAREEILNVSLQGYRKQLIGLDVNDPDFVDTIDGAFQAAHRDLKSQIDMQAFNQWRADVIIQLAEQHLSLKPFEAAMRKDRNGNPLMSTRQGLRLQNEMNRIEAAIERERNKSETADAVTLGLMKRDLSAASEEGELNDDLLNSARDIGMTESALSSYVKTNLETLDHQQQLGENAMAIVNGGGSALIADMTGGEYDEQIDFLRRGLTESTGEAVMADKMVSVVESSYARFSTGTRRRVNSGLRTRDSGALTDTLSIIRDVETNNPSALGGLLDDGNDTRYDTMRVMQDVLGLGVDDIVKGFDGLAENTDNARDIMATRPVRDHLYNELSDADLPAAQHKARIEKVARTLLAVGAASTGEDAIDLAIERAVERTAKVGQLGSRLRLDVSEIDPRLGQQNIYNAFEKEVLQTLMDEETLKAARGVTLFDALPLEGSLTGKIIAHPMRDGVTWVYHADTHMPLAVLETDPIFNRVLENFVVPQAETQRRLAVEAHERVQKKRAKALKEPIFDDLSGP